MTVVPLELYANIGYIKDLTDQKIASSLGMGENELRFVNTRLSSWV